jgi:hypothetical protein
LSQGLRLPLIHDGDAAVRASERGELRSRPGDLRAVFARAFGRAHPSVAAAGQRDGVRFARLHVKTLAVHEQLAQRRPLRRVVARPPLSASGKAPDQGGRRTPPPSLPSPRPDARSTRHRLRSRVPCGRSPAVFLCFILPCYVFGVSSFIARGVLCSLTRWAQAVPEKELVAGQVSREEVYLFRP